MSSTVPRLEADAEGPDVVVRLYGVLFEMSAEITPAAARRLAAGLIQAAEESEAMSHVES
ncbi:MAG: hypothetical protein EPN60_16095 [Nevskiaceae bacterium]|nr:MAG: hypothetical protein EPN60_16095 [Nevskiaceae bacterium]